MMFTIGMVNYKTEIYIETQLRIYEGFAGMPYEIIIADTSRSKKFFQRAQDIISRFPRLKIRLYSYDPPGKYGSAAHGDGLQYIYEQVNTKYLLVHDPDFFWVKPHFLRYLVEKFEEGYVTIGAPYACYSVLKGKHPWFPSAFGAAYRVDMLQKSECHFRYEAALDQNGCLKDVGWKVRENLCEYPYFSFEQERAILPIESISYKSSDSLWRRYRDRETKETVAYHLHRGSFETHPSAGYKKASGKMSERVKLQQREVPEKWQNNRKKVCALFWEEINKAASMQI